MFDACTDALHMLWKKDTKQWKSDSGNVVFPIVLAIGNILSEYCFVFELVSEYLGTFLIIISFTKVYQVFQKQQDAWQALGFNILHCLVAFL